MTRLRPMGFSFTLAFATIVLLSAVPTSAQLAAHLEAERESYLAADRVAVRFTFTNETDSAVSVLKWLTPLAGFDSDMFTVASNGEPVRYIGVKVRRGAPMPEDYVVIEPGQSMEVELDLSEAYDIFEAGSYTAEYKSITIRAAPETPATLAARGFGDAKELRSNAVQFEISEPRTRSPAATREVPEHKVEATKEGLEEASATEPRVPIFKHCSASEKTDTSQALSAGQDIALNASFALLLAPTSNRPTAPRYKTWFGAYTATRYDTVSDNFVNIYDALQNRQMEFNCDCDPAYSSAYAYVYPSAPYEVYLCGAFWTAPLNGANSRADTLVHEVSHFTVVADTDDIVYGQTGSKNLATNNPGQAIKNADNYAYFAANPEGQDMGPIGIEFAIGWLAVTMVIVLVARRYYRYRLRRPA